MTFSAEFRCYIGSEILVPWGTAVAGLPPPWLTALGPAVVAHDVMSVARYGPTSGGSYRRAPRWYAPAAVGHDGRCIDLQNFLRTIYFCKIEIEKYI
jgi:hypothetical protein